MVKHHPDTRLLNEHASGTLPLAQSACVSLHLNYCKQCRRDYQRLQQMGAALFEDLAPQQVDDSVLRTVMARVGEEQPPLTYTPPPKSETHDFPSLVQRLMKVDYDDLEWKRINSDLRIHRLRTGDVDNEFALYHIKAGGKIPRHTHHGSEMTLVLEGGFSDADGTYHQGDFLLREPGDVHAPTAVQSEDCICLAVLDAPLKFTGWKYRWMNPFLQLNTG
mgnify:CR=1 FL=1